MDKVKPSNWEHVTPHKLVILALIKNYTDIVDERHPIYKRIIWNGGNNGKRKLDRTLLLWMQQPDGSLKSILRTIDACSKVLYSALCATIKSMCDISNARGIEDFFKTISSELFESEQALLQNDGVIGLFCRRMILYFAQMPFSYFQNLHDNLCKHCAIILSKKYQKSQKLSDSLKNEESGLLSHSSGDEYSSCNQSVENNDAMELESQSELDSHSSDESLGNSDLKPSDLKSISVKEDPETQQVFTSAQACRFFAEQAALINNKESMALPPKLLQTKINHMIKNNSQLAEAHYLTYLNSLRIKEYCGAMDALLLYFNLNLKQADSSSMVIGVHKSTCHYAALNMAFLHFCFGHTAEAITSAKEAFKLCNISNDKVCLHHVVSLLHQLDPKSIKMPSLLQQIKFAKVLNLQNMTADNVQRDSKNAIAEKSPSQIVLQLISSQLLSHKVSAVNYCHIGCLFKMYGIRSLSGLNLQLALHFQDCKTSSFEYTQKNSEEIVLSICHLMEILAEDGKISASNELLNHLKVRFPVGTKFASIWQISSLKLQHRNLLFSRRVSECVRVEQEMEVFDFIESKLAKAKRLYANEDLENCCVVLNELLNISETKSDNKLNVEILCQIYTLLGEVFCIQAVDSALSLSYTLQAFSIAKQNYLQGCMIDALLLICQYHVLNGFNTLACNLLKSFTYQCMANGSLLQKSRFHLIYVKCHLAIEPDWSLGFINQCIATLKKAKKGFIVLQALVLQKHTLCILACLYNKKLDLTLSNYDYEKVLTQRNASALKFNQLDQTTLNFSPQIF